MTALAVFNFGEQVVRVTDRDGAPWFVGRDVCAALAIARPQNALARVPDDEKGALIVGTPGGDQQMIVISEAGMYRLVLTSRTEPAERFKTWVVSEVLPSIRRTGAYRLPSHAAETRDSFAEEFASEVGVRRINGKVAFVRSAGATFGPGAAQEAWRRAGLPDVDPRASRHWRPETDPGIARWFAERVEVSPADVMDFSAFYTDYVRWCRWFSGATAREEKHLRDFLDLHSHPHGDGRMRGLALREAPSMIAASTDRTRWHHNLR